MKRSFNIKYKIKYTSKLVACYLHSPFMLSGNKWIFIIRDFAAVAPRTQLSQSGLLLNAAEADVNTL